MRLIVRGRRFDDQLKRLKRRGYDIRELFAVVDLLAEDGELPAAYHPHRLIGEWGGVWECHIEADWLLIYEITDREVILIRTGTHSELFD
jgi:mRNA interferase YafQ